MNQQNLPCTGSELPPQPERYDGKKYKLFIYKEMLKLARDMLLFKNKKI